MVYNKTGTDDTLDFWIDAFVTIHDKHAPYKHKRVKSFPKPKWFSKELQEAIYLRDFPLPPPPPPPKKKKVF